MEVPVKKALSWARFAHCALDREKLRADRGGGYASSLDRRFGPIRARFLVLRSEPAVS